MKGVHNNNSILAKLRKPGFSTIGVGEKSKPATQAEVTKPAAKPPTERVELSGNFGTKAPNTSAPVAEQAPSNSPPQTKGPVEVQEARPALQSLGKGPLGGELAQTASGALVVFEEPSTSLSSGLVTSGPSLAEAAPPTGPAPKGGVARTGLESSMTAAFAGTGLPGLVKESFTEAEFKALNPGAYHDDQHPLHVGETVAGVAKAAGRSPERIRFLQQVALLHDADERVDTKSGDVGDTKTPASVHRTLEWMDKNDEALKKRMGWEDDSFKEAKALIARTDFPFDDNPRNSGTSYDGESPAQTYRKLLQDVPAEKRAGVMEDGLMLRFSDQVGNYTSTYDKAENFVLGLGQELRGVGVPVKDDQLLKDTPTFLASAGADLDHDQKIASEFGLKPDLKGRDQLMELLPDKLRTNFNSNLSAFESK